MNGTLRDGDSFIFMKIGLHAQEPVDEIIDRKRQELEAAGMIFWGYGGNTCHPKTFVQPFARTVMDHGAQLRIAMHKMDSQHDAEPKLAEEYSQDGVHWEPIPEGIQVRGSRYAMVLGGLETADFDLSLRDISVAIGPKRGATGVDYLRGHVDKGCFRYHESGEVAEERERKHIDLIAPVIEPFAVFLK